MKKGFNDKNKVHVEIDKNELQNLIKKYKKIKKYQKSNLYELHKLNGTETIISSLLNDDENNINNIV